MGADVLHYLGNVVDELVAQGEARHLFGPDICGAGGSTDEDVRNSFRTGTQLPPPEVLGRGAFYEVTAAHYDPDTNLTTAYFVPYVDPRRRVRYHGGTADPNDQLTGPTLHNRDKIRGH